MFLSGILPDAPKKKHASPVQQPDICKQAGFNFRQDFLETIGGTTGWNLRCFMIMFSWSNVKCTCWQRKYYKTTLVCFTRSRLSKNIYKHIWTCKVIPIKIKQKSTKSVFSAFLCFHFSLIDQISQNVVNCPTDDVCIVFCISVFIIYFQIQVTEKYSPAMC